MRFDLIKRREFIKLVGGAAAAWPLAARAQGTGNRHIGFLYPGPQVAAVPRISAFMDGLQTGGINPQQITLHPQVTGGDPTLLAPMAAELVKLNVDLIVAASPGAIKAAMAATHTIPIAVTDLESDPVAAGFVASNPRPGGNVTGVFLDFPDFGKKWLQALQEAIPQVSPVGVFWDPTSGPTQRKAVQMAAEQFGEKLIVIEVHQLSDAEGAFRSLAQQGAHTLLLLPSPVVGGNTKLLADLALKNRLPSVSVFPQFARDGGLMAYGPDLMGFFRQLGGMAAKIFRGANIADLPIETPTRFEFVLNLRTAKLLDLTMPASMLVRADEVIE
jgi:putative tryptophan/tyrosine transport system substrate-binding protein